MSKFYTGQRIILEAEKNLADDSPDHIEPFGTRRDNTRNIAFNKKLYNFWEDSKQLKILDLGCSGGGFVKDCIDGGQLAIGLDGSDYSKKVGRAEWRTIPDYLFTCDITKEFNLFIDQDGKKQRLLFDVITLWDVMEHLQEKDLDDVFNNLKSNLSKDGIIIMSVGHVEEIINGVKLHQTTKPKEWWLNKFKEQDLIEPEGYMKYFRNQWVKGTYKYPWGFNIVLAKCGSNYPEVKKQGLKEIMFDIWADSKLQLIIRRFIFGYVK